MRDQEVEELVREIQVYIAEYFGLDERGDEAAEKVNRLAELALASRAPEVAPPPTGPWHVADAGVFAGHQSYYLRHDNGRAVLATEGKDFSEAEAIAVRDALNRVSGLGEPTP